MTFLGLFCVTSSFNAPGRINVCRWESPWHEVVLDFPPSLPGYSGSEDSVAMETLLQGYDEQDEDQVSRVCNSPLLKYMDNDVSSFDLWLEIITVYQFGSYVALSKLICWSLSGQLTLAVGFLCAVKKYSHENTRWTSGSFQKINTSSKSGLTNLGRWHWTMDDLHWSKCCLKIFIYMKMNWKDKLQDYYLYIHLYEKNMYSNKWLLWQ